MIEQERTGAVARRSKPKVTEAHIQETCSAYLALDDWRRVRTDLKHLRGMGVQEPGMADDLYIRYLDKARIECPCGMKTAVLKPPAAEVLFVEWKRKTGKTAAHQHAWHAAERARGALTWIAGIDFIASIEGFIEHYLASGLARRFREASK